MNGKLIKTCPRFWGKRSSVHRRRSQFGGPPQSLKLAFAGQRQRSEPGQWRGHSDSVDVRLGSAKMVTSWYGVGLRRGTGTRWRM